MVLKKLYLHCWNNTSLKRRLGLVTGAVFGGNWMNSRKKLMQYNAEKKFNFEFRKLTGEKKKNYKRQQTRHWTKASGRISFSLETYARANGVVVFVQFWILNDDAHRFSVKTVSRRRTIENYMNVVYYYYYYY